MTKNAIVHLALKDEWRSQINGEQRKMVFTDLQKLRCIERELNMRKKVYPRWVRNGNMPAETADYEIAVMKEIMEEYSARIHPEVQEKLV